MRHQIRLFVLAGLLILCAAPSSAAPVAHLQGDRLVLENKGHVVTVPAEEASAAAVKDAAGNPLPDLRYCGIGVDSAKAHGLTAGLYLFDAKGKQVAFAPTENAEYCSEVRLSPGKTILAMDSGTWLVRSWFFFRYPGLAPLGEVVYYQDENKPALLWQGEDGVYFSSMQTEGHKRSCDYDPCGPVSVRAYSFKTGKATTLLAGTDLCNFTLTGYAPEKGTVTADELCLSSAQAWKTFPEKAPVKRVTVKGTLAGQ